MREPSPNRVCYVGAFAAVEQAEICEAAVRCHRRLALAETRLAVHSVGVNDGKRGDVFNTIQMQRHDVVYCPTHSS